jgi:hypothetical protein
LVGNNTDQGQGCQFRQVAVKNSIPLSMFRYQSRLLYFLFYSITYLATISTIP